MEGMCQWYVLGFFHLKCETNEAVIRCPVTRCQQKTLSQLRSNLGRMVMIQLPLSVVWPLVTPPSEVLSTQLLQSSATDREAEHERWCKNGNVPSGEDRAGGKNLNQTCLQLAIERPGTTSGGRATSHYFCIACDKFCANNSRYHAFEHAGQRVSFDEGLTIAFAIET